jgi:hypothetical protein
LRRLFFVVEFLVVMPFESCSSRKPSRRDSRSVTIVSRKYLAFFQSISMWFAGFVDQPHNFISIH